MAFMTFRGSLEISGENVSQHSIAKLLDAIEFELSDCGAQVEKIPEGLKFTVPFSSMFSFSGDNLLALINSGELRVENEDSERTVNYRLSFVRTFVVFSLFLMPFAVARWNDSYSSGHQSLSGGVLGTLLLLLVVFGLNAVVGTYRFTRMIRRAERRRDYEGRASSS